MIKWAIRRAGRVVTVSRALRDELVKLGVDESHVEVLRNGVDLELFRADGRAEPDPAAPRLLVVGHLKPGKGHFAVLEALLGLSNCVLTIAGDGPLRRPLEERARALHVDDRVRFLGSVPHVRLAEQYRSADALILASEREGMPNVVLEALACGTPVIATRVGGVPEIMTDPVAGILLESASGETVAAGVRELLAQPRDPRRIREFARRFDWEVATQGQLAIFRRLAGGAGGGFDAHAAVTGNG